MYNHYYVFHQIVGRDMYTKVFLDPVIIHQQASAQDLSNSGFFIIFTGAIRQNRELGITPDTAYSTGIIIIYTREETQKRLALRSAFFGFHLHRESIFSIHQPITNFGRLHQTTSTL